MTALLATIKKELLLLLRDIHGLMLLFVMPVAFILIMSLALQNQFAQNANSKKITVLLDDQAKNDSADSVIKLLQERKVFSWQVTDSASAPEKIRHDEAAFLLTLHQKDRQDGKTPELDASILVAPATNPQIEAIFTATVGEAMSKQRIETLLRNIKMKHALNSDFSMDDGIDEDALNSNPVTVRYSYQRHTEEGEQSTSAQPTSVQQSVPAWLVFAMFFSVVPLANTLISERQQGTLRRLRTMPVSPALPIVGKLIPYFVINQIQVLLMLTVGVYLMPLFGADSLTLGHSLAGLVLMSTCLSLAALGYGILIAVVASTTDQATTLGGIGNILLAALGGVMVPRFVMPDTMQKIASFSPMSWGLEGFLDIFLRNGSVADVLPEAGSLFAFGAVTIALALLLSRRKI
jgi:ABC-2 type transport system permease protein